MWDFVPYLINTPIPPLSETVTGNLRHPDFGPHLLAQLLVLGFQALAVAAPWSVELNQNIFAVVIDDGVKVLCHHHLQTEDTGYGKALGSWMLSPRARWRSHLDRSIIVLWDGLWLQVRLQGPIEVAQQESFQSFPVRSVNMYSIVTFYFKPIFCFPWKYDVIAEGCYAVFGHMHQDRKFHASYKFYKKFSEL